MDKVCVLLPALDEGERVGAVVRGILALNLEARVSVVVVDDGSTDDTVLKARAAGARVESLGANLGVGAALRRGFELARAEGFDYLVHIDADGQIDPAHIPALLAPVRAGEADVAIGSRFHNGPPAYLTPWKAAALRVLASAVGLVVDTPLTDLSCGIRCLGGTAIAAARPRFQSDYIQETLLQFFGAGLTVVEVPVTAVAREGRRGLSARTFSYSIRYLLLLAFALSGFFVERLRRAALAPLPSLRPRLR